MKTSDMKEYHKNWFSNKKQDPDFMAKRARQFTEWYAKNKQKRKEYRKKYQKQNKDIINEKRRVKSKEKLQNNPHHKIRCYLSNAINRQLSKNKTNKNGISCIVCLEYSIEKLKEHLESQFEPWMNWNNRGKYNSKNWDDNDSSTWTWQIDHIIPHSNFQYTSMTDEAFQKCWSLTNLRPLSAKMNIIKAAK